MTTKKTLGLVLFLALSNILSAQHLSPIEKNVFRLSAGLGYEEGFVVLTKIPSLGISYERILSKRFSIATHLFSYYRNRPDSYLNSSPNGGAPIIDLVTAGNSGPFVSKEEIESIINTGLQNLSPNNTIKMLSVPIDVGITFYPISSRKHRVGINLAASMTYESSNWSRDYFEGATLTLENGEVYENAFLSLNTEFRNWTPGTSVKLLYEFQQDNYALGFRLGNYNRFLFSTANYPIWETSLYLAFKW